MWEAKNIAFDTAGGFDVQFLVGAGVDHTIQYLQSRSDREAGAALAYILECRDAGDFDDLDEWAEGRDEYFRGVTGG